MAIKKIDVSQLQPGMFVMNFKTHWEKHPFYMRRLHIDSDEQIRLVAGSGIQEVFIDTSRGRDVPTGAAAMVAASRGPSAEDIRLARQLLADASKVVRRAFADVRQGRKVDLPAMQEMAADVAESVIRDRDLMMLLCGMHQQRPNVFDHCVNVGVLLINFGHQQGLPVDQVRALALGGLLHDLSLGGSDSTHLDAAVVADDYAHVGRTLVRLAAFDLPLETLAVVGEHHERVDGSGYPHGLVGDEISLYGAMGGIADTYDQLCSPRLCGPGLAEGMLLPPAAMAQMFEWGGRYYDTVLSTGFVRAIGIYPVGSLVRLDSGLLAVVIRHRPGDLLSPLVRVIYDPAVPGRVVPEDRDLAEAPWYGHDRIVAPEDPRRWGISIENCLDLRRPH